LLECRSRPLRYRSSGYGSAALLYVHTVSALSDVATVHMLMADYAQAEGGKLNVIGGGITVAGRSPNIAVTAPFSLVVSVEVPPDHYDSEAAVEIILEDPAGDVVTVPGAATDDERWPVVRVSQTARFTGPIVPPYLRFPEQFQQGYLPSRVYMVIGFPTGLPLPSGAAYLWRVAVDGQTRDAWTERFVVAEQVQAAASAANTAEPS
jgi:hypothetical protein